MGAELPDADVSELDVLDSLEEDVTADPLLAAADEEAPDVVPAPVDACAPELAAVLPAVGIETPIFRDSSAAVRGSAASALLHLGPDDSLAPAVIDAVKQKDYVTRVVLTPALRGQAVGQGTLAPALFDLARNAPDGEVRDNAHYALRDLGIVPP